jgi:hypothetical protein
VEVPAGPAAKSAAAKVPAGPAAKSAAAKVPAGPAAKSAAAKVPAGPAAKSAAAKEPAGNVAAAIPKALASKLAAAKAAAVPVAKANPAKASGGHAAEASTEPTWRYTKMWYKNSNSIGIRRIGNKQIFSISNKQLQEAELHAIADQCLIKLRQGQSEEVVAAWSHKQCRD